ncbi:peptidylprolyl isomerase [Catenovulum maritimum]|uniref:Peptidyl-prolyl cis-trans isomerase n=1 Tax=Catenovulum maritimum TaxID=1513271 RepID=A0A0J8JMC1_9ALTE|nr:peptidylprolyl isomerase [Catenovulum maritimum]KMT65751.1 peptidylprolyl isomerase [Catenovulum maritimum]
MNIEKDSVITMHYIVKNSHGEEIDSSRDGEPMTFLHGQGFLISGLENELTGKTVGDKFECKIEAADAYGVYHDELVQALPISVFDAIEEIHEGMQLRASTDQGEQSVIITEITDETVTVDGNHPLAGVDLEFNVEIIAVRAATEEELAHGHVHAEGGCGSHHHHEDDCCDGDHKH